MTSRRSKSHAIIADGVLTVAGTIVLAVLLLKFIIYDERKGLSVKIQEEKLRNETNES